jgi:hypothetical protein
MHHFDAEAAPSHSKKPLDLNTSWLGHFVVLPFIKHDEEELQVVSTLWDFYGKHNGLIMNLEKMKLFLFMFTENDMKSDRKCLVREATTEA